MFPPGCFGTKRVTSYTPPRTITQQSLALECFATSSAVNVRAASMSTLSLTSRASRDDFPALRAAERAARGVNVTRASLVIVTGARRLDRRARHETLER